MLRRKIIILSGVLALAVPTVAHAETGVDRFDSTTGTTAIDTKFRPGSANPDATVTVMIELTGDPVAVVQSRTATRLSSARAASIRADLKRSQDRLKAQLRGRGGKVLSQMQSAYNGMRVALPRKQLKAVAALPGVKSVTAARTYKIQNTVSVPYLGVPRVWQKTKYLGENVKVAIIDTGIDYTHADFGGPGTVDAFNTAKASSTFTPTVRVKGGYDFVGDDYDADTPANATPKPDANPLDCNGHGSHVAGTTGGGGVNADGTPYTGPYDASTPSHDFKVGPGVAPKVDLYALKVFGCEGSTDVVTEAIDWAVKNQIQVINMSLGSDYGRTSDADSIASENAQAAGVVVVASAGNAGPNPYLTGSPGVARGVINVAAVDSTAGFPGAALKLPGGTVAAINANDADLPAGPYRVVYVRDDSGTGENEALGCSKAAFSQAGIDASPTAPLQIAVVRRGDCARVAKAIYGQQAGADAVVMVNTDNGYPPFEGEILSNPDDETPYTVTIPFLGVRSSDNAALQAADDKSLTLAAQPLSNPGFTGYGSFSSGGPRNDDSGLKPSVSAPGVSIRSAAVGTGTGAEVLSGTSMAAPHVAGVAALARQAHKDWKSYEIASALVSTADPAKVAGYRLTRGGGLVDPSQVVGTSVYAYGDSYRTRAGRVYDASLSYGFAEPEASKGYRGTRTLTLVNKSTKKVTFTLRDEKTNQTRSASVSFSPKKVTVAAKKSRTVTVTLRATASKLGDSMSTTDQFSFREVSGNVKITTNSRGTLRVPYLMVPRAQAKVAAKQQLLKAPLVTDVKTNGRPTTAGAKPATTVAANARTLQVTLTNPKGAMNTVADFYTWGLESSNDLSYRAPGGVDLRAAGVQELPLENDTLLVFAVNSWTRSSNAATVDYDVEIDVNRDGKTDYILFSMDSGLVRAGDADGLSETFILDVAKDVVFAPGRPMVAPTDSSTVLLPLAASDLGLTGSKPFDYRVASYSIVDDAYSDTMNGVATYQIGKAPIANGNYEEVKVNRTVTVRLGVDVEAVADQQPLGTMIVVLDNKAGKDEARLLRTPAI